MRHGLVVIALLASFVAAAQEANARAQRIAEASPEAKRALAYVLTQVRALPDGPIREQALALVENPAPTFMERLASPRARAEVRQALVDAGLLAPSVSVAALFPPLADPRRAPQPFLSAPAQAPTGHHDYPGGLAEHTAVNLEAALGWARDYHDRFGVPLGPTLRTEVVAAAALHDVMKPWCLQWREDGTTTAEATIASTASHHIFAIAEALHRKLPAEFIVVLASAHSSALLEPAAVVGYLRAGAILAGVDPVAYGLLVKNGDGYALARPPPIAAAIDNLADHDYVLSGPVAKTIEAALDRLALAQHPGLDAAALRWIHHRVQSRLSGIALYAIWQRGGDRALARAIAAAHLSLDARASAPVATGEAH